jgi:hypothetical protein
MGEPDEIAKKALQDAGYVVAEVDAKPNFHFVWLNAHLVWTKTPPTEPGWYWIRGGLMAARKPTPVEVWLGEFGMIIRHSNGGNTYIDNLPHIEWAGPIQEPPDTVEVEEKEGE